MSDFDLERAAAVMFGDTTPTSAQATSTAQRTPDQDTAERMFGKPSQAPRPATHRDARPFAELSEQQQADRFYGNTDPTKTHADATQAIVNASMEDHLQDPETAAQVAKEWATTFAQHKLNSTESKELADIGASVMRESPTAEVLAQWQDTAITNLQTEYGVAGAGQALQDARAYVASVPGAAALIDSLGLGSHPKVVALAATRGRALRLNR